LVSDTNFHTSTIAGTGSHGRAAAPIDHSHRMPLAVSRKARIRGLADTG